MKTRYLLLFFILLAAVSCIDDKSNTGGKIISRITFKEGTGDVKALLDTVSDRHDRIILMAPDVLQEGIEKTLAYRWEINYELVSEDQTLTYDCPALSPAGGFPCRLTVSNEDGMNWIDFRLRVMTPFERGIFVLSEHNNDTYVSYKRDDRKDTDFLQDVYNLSNPDFPLGSKPKCIVKHIAGFGGNRVQNIWIGTEEPLRIAKINAQTFETRNFLSYPRTKIDHMISTGSANGIVFVADGEFMELDTNQDAFTNFGQQLLGMMYPGNYVEPVGVRAAGAYAGAYTYLMYESTYNVLFHGGGFEASELSIDLTGLRVFNITELGTTAQEALVNCETDEGEPVILYINAKTGALKQRINASGSGISASSAFVSHPTRILAYYSVGNRVYGFNYDGGASLPDTPMLTVGSTGDVIRKMEFSPDYKRIYVAYEKPSGDMPGCVAAFDVEEDVFTLAWDEQNVAGKIVDILIQ